MIYVLYRDRKNLCCISPQNRFTLKKFETTMQEIGLINHVLKTDGDRLFKDLLINKIFSRQILS